MYYFFVYLCPKHLKFMNNLVAIMLVLLTAAPLSAAAGEKAKDKTAAQPTAAAPVTTRYYIDITGVSAPPAQQPPCVKLSLGRSVLATLGISQGELNTMARDHMLLQPIDAMNFLAEYGWTLANIYTESDRRGTTTHWIAYKDAAHPNELLDGLADKKR